MARPPSRIEAMAAAVLSELGLEFESEYRFAPPRRWRADFRCWHASGRCLLEVEGVTSFGSHLGRHQSARGFVADCDKYAAAFALGWPVLRVTEAQIADGTMAAALAGHFWPDVRPYAVPAVRKAAKRKRAAPRKAKASRAPAQIEPELFARDAA